MSEDWDLFAVVRSCSSSVGTCKQKDPPPPPPPPLFPHIHRDRESSSSSSCNELQDSCKPFLPVTTTTWSSPPPVPSNVVMKQEQRVLEPVDDKPRIFPASTSSSVFVFKGQRDQLLQQHSQAPLRSRKRKNQQKRTICHVTQENLSSDMWAWRKYGQKPIKGSPYPRNYYRCSSSKGCLARKQVERSNLESNIFIVTYTGEHTHPRPTHRNSLAGSTRNKSSQPLPKPDHHPSGSSDDAVKQEIIHLSPTTPLKENDDVQVNEQVNKEEDEEFDEEEEDDDVDDDDDDVDDLLIPNLAVRDRDDLLFTADFTHWSAGSVGDGGG